MKAIIDKFKTDQYNVFVKGNADTTQMARVFFILATPSLSSLLIFGQFPS